MPAQFGLLKTKRFLPLFLTQFLGALNDNVFKNALVMLITYRAAATSGIDPRQLVVIASAIFILPFFLFSATAGQLADKYDKAQLIRVIKTVEIVLMLMASAGFLLQNDAMLLGVLFLGGTHSAFFGPLKYSILPEHLEENELVGGNALVEAGTFLAILLGTIIGGIFILKTGGGLVISLVILAVAVTGWMASRKIPPAPAGAPRLEISANFIAETWRIIRYAQGNRSVFIPIIGISWFWLLGFAFLAQFPVYGKDVIGGDASIVTLFLTVFSVGIALGSLICNKLLKGRISAAYVPMGAFGMTASIIALWIASPTAAAHVQLVTAGQFLSAFAGWPVLTSLLAIAMFGGIYIVPLYTLMQTRCAESHRSRVIAANNILNALFMAGGALATMALTRLHMQVTEIFLLLGVCNIPVGILMRRVASVENNI